MSKKLISALLILCLVCLPLFALADGTLNVFNYGEYIDEQVIRNFEKEFGVRVNYSLNSTPEEMYTKLQTGASFDVIVTSDYMIDRLIKEERILPLDKEIVTNLDQITDNMKGLYFDPDNTYSAPYLWQNVVLCYDTTKIDPAKVEEKGWEILLIRNWTAMPLSMNPPRRLHDGLQGAGLFHEHRQSRRTAGSL